MCLLLDSLLSLCKIVFNFFLFSTMCAFVWQSFLWLSFARFDSKTQMKYIDLIIKVKPVFLFCLVNENNHEIRMKKRRENIVRFINITSSLVVLVDEIKSDGNAEIAMIHDDYYRLGFCFFSSSYTFLNLYTN